MASATAARSPRPVASQRPPTRCDGVVTDGEPLTALRSLARATPKELQDALLRVHCRYPKRTALAKIGKSHQGRPIMALWIGEEVHPGHERPSFFLNGSHHGDELISTDFVLDAIATLLAEGSDEAQRWLQEVVVVAVPLLNPDGRVITLTVNRSGRKNGRDNDGDGEREATEGVDLNRNYPFQWGTKGEDASRSDLHHKWYRGPYPSSEPETRAVMRLAIAEHFVASVSFHSGAVALLAPYTINGLRDPEPAIGRMVAKRAFRAMPVHPQGLVEFKRNLYPVDGTDQDWHYHRHGTVALLVEGAQKSALGPWHRERAFRATRAVWTTLIDRYLDGPAVYGQVVDRAGRPVVAQVDIEEITLHEGERWMSRCRDGRYHRYLPGPGRYTVVARAAQGPVARRVVQVQSGRVQLDMKVDYDDSTRRLCPAAIRGN